MLKNYFILALRNLRKHSLYTFINVAGLAIGMACGLLILLYARNELSYDQFHEHVDHTYRIGLEVQRQDLDLRTAYTAYPLGPALQSDFPEVEQATRLWHDPIGSMTVRYEDQAFPEDRVFFADPNVFEVLTFPLLQGDPATALRDPFTVVITESTARKYFGDADPMGRALVFREQADNDLFSYTVTGVMADLPANSHLAFDFLASYVTHWSSRAQSWLGFGVYTYLRLDPQAEPADFEAKLPALFATYGGPRIQETFGMTLSEFNAAGNSYRHFLQPIDDIHLSPGLDDEPTPTGNPTLIYLFMAIAVFVLVLACINFINLATARASRRAAEVGVRKALGSQRGQLIGQFLGEAVLLSLLALVFAVALVQLALPAFAGLTGTPLDLSSADVIRYFPALLGLGVLVGILAGAYPAFFLSGFRPVAVLKGRHHARRRSRLRDGLVVFQFGIATALVACTAIVYSQMRFLLDKPLGFDAGQVVVLNDTEVLRPQIEAFRQALLALPGITSVTNSEQVPGRAFNGSTFSVAGAPANASVVLEYTFASYGYVETLGLELVVGRSLSRDFPTDSLAVLLNESAVRHLGLADPVGQRLIWNNQNTYTIVGVVKDFHIASLHQPIGPMVLLGPDPEHQNRPNMLVSARVQTDDLPRTLEAIKATWNRFAPEQPFVYSFLDQDFARLYQAEQRTRRLITLFAGLAVLIACIGLFGLAAYTAEQRTKEIGVRKVLGASVAGIVTLLSKDFLKLVLIGFVIAIPIAWYAMNRWLQDFAYRIEIGAGVFLLAGLTAVLIALATVSWQSVKAAMKNPVESLRSE